MKKIACCSLHPILRSVFKILIAIVLFAETAFAAQLKVMRMGLGSGKVTSSDNFIDCNPGSMANCSATYPGGTVVTLTATADPGSVFVRWEGDGTGTTITITLTMSTARSVRAVFDLVPDIPPLTSFTILNLRNYLNANPSVNSPARFLKALPIEFKRNWLLVTRSESLQTGTAESPRLILPSADAKVVFTIGLMENSSYPGSHPNAVEYMQWDPNQKNFLFHEIVLNTIPNMGRELERPNLPNSYTFPTRSRGVEENSPKCSQCHSTRNVPNRSMYPGTTGVIPGTVQYKSKPNWDSYDSWAGLMPFNRDRIYQGSVEAAAFRKLFNLWTWRANHSVRAIIEQLELQPPGVSTAHTITRTVGGPNDGQINFSFDQSPPVLIEPPPVGSSTIRTDYSFNGAAVTVSTEDGTSVTQSSESDTVPQFVTLHHSVTPTNDEGRGVQLFDLLGGGDGRLNQERIAHELNNHRFATGNFPIDVRPLALAIAKGWIARSGNTVISTVGPALNSGAFPFFNGRHGPLNLDAPNPPGITPLVDDTKKRSQSVPHRKADIQKFNLNRSGDDYVQGATVQGLIQRYGTTTSEGTSTADNRLRQEIFRRSTDGFSADSDGTMGGIYVDREAYSVNTERIALFRYFLEPLGVSVDKWSMGVRARSNTYTFADVFGEYISQIISDLTTSLSNDGLLDPNNGTQVIDAVNTMLFSLPSVNDVPRFTDVQRIFNKACIECHGGLLYPPYGRFVSSPAPGHLDLSEDESPTTTTGVSPRLQRSYNKALSRTTTSLSTSDLYTRITRSEDDPGFMPKGGPPLSAVDIATIRRWIEASTSRPFTVGDTHLRTVDGVNYDFQAVGEFVLLRDEYIELQSRQTAVPTDGPLGPNKHTGLTSCVSVNTAVAIRIGSDRITYQPKIDPNGQPDPTGLQLRINGQLVKPTSQAIPLASGGRVIQTTAPESIQVDAPGGTVIVITAGYWANFKVWYLNVDARAVRAVTGLMGAIPPGNWLPALPDGKFMGPRPTSLQQRYQDLYEKFGKAWRVTDETTLFDYADDTSTETFTIESWPNGESPQSCIPRRQPGIINNPPQPPLPLSEAEKACDGVLDADHRANCIQDVMATGERGFALTYLQADLIGRNTIPKAPSLLTPVDFPTNKLGKTVTFSWNRTADQDGDPITYKFNIWAAGQTPNNNNAELVSSSSDKLSIKRVNRLAVLEWLGTGAQLQTAGSVAGPWTVANASSPYSVTPSEAIQFFRLRSVEREQISKTVSNLLSGQLYYWRVIAEDSKGGTVESETRAFEVLSDPQIACSTCSDFLGFDNNARLGPSFSLGGLEFEDDANSALLSSVKVMETNVKGLVFPDDGITITLPVPRDQICLEIWNSGAPVVIEAFGSGGKLITRMSVSSNSIVLPYKVTGNEITTIRLSGGSYEGALVRICN